jgi:hypothetical protein
MSPMQVKWKKHEKDELTRCIQVVRLPIFFSGLETDRNMWFVLK